MVEHGQDAAIDLSIVCAVFNEADSVDALITRVAESTSKLGIETELVVVDDGSSDDTLKRLKNRLSDTPMLRIVELSRNFGQIGALGAGLTAACGRLVVTMDGDLQHDPSDIGRLLQFAEKGNDLVATYREERGEGLRRKVITAVGNRVNRFLTGLDVRDFGSAFRLIDARILDELRDLQGRVHYNTPMLYAAARRVVQIPIVQHPREHGASKWTLAMFVSYNLDFVTVSPRLTQLMLTGSFLAFLSGVVLYGIHLLNLVENVEAASAPAFIMLSSLQLALLAIVWREVIETQKLAQGKPPFVIRRIWSASDIQHDSEIGESP